VIDLIHYYEGITRMKTNTQVLMDPGTYYLGDLCYVMHESWSEFCDLTINDHECLEGGFRLKDGTEFVTFQTMYGDGTYFDSEHNAYSVDAGLIGCIRLEDIDEDYEDNDVMLGHIHVFDKQFLCEKVDGIIYFGRVAIDTDPQDLYDEVEDDNY
jgi:hypothetical protein